MVNYSDALARLFESPEPARSDGSGRPGSPAAGETLISNVPSRGEHSVRIREQAAARRLWNPIVGDTDRGNSAEAVAMGEKIGFPVVLKLHSEAITHKTDVGGVQLNLQNGEDVASAFEKIRKSVQAKAGDLSPSGQKNFLGVHRAANDQARRNRLILGSSIDPQFGPVLLFGTGGQLVEVFKRSRSGLAPTEHNAGATNDGGD